MVTSGDFTRSPPPPSGVSLVMRDWTRMVPAFRERRTWFSFLFLVTAATLHRRNFSRATT